MTSLALQQFGATVGQSIGDHLVVGSTLKLLRGGLAAASGTLADASLDRASELEGEAETHVDLDVGAMVSFGRMRVGAVVKNLRQPAFTSGARACRPAAAGARRVARRRRPGEPAGAGSVTFAVDADLTRTATARGDVRHIAAGVEAWMLRRQLGVRGGVSANTVGDARPAAGGGVSVACARVCILDAEATRGSDQTRKGWGFGLRVTF